MLKFLKKRPDLNIILYRTFAYLYFTSVKVPGDKRSGVFGRIEFTLMQMGPEDL